MTLVRILLAFSLSYLAAAAEQFDVIVYGGTAGGVTAAVEAARAGASVALVEPGRFLGGLTSCGVAPPTESLPDVDPPEFYRRAGKRYGKGAAWSFEPHVAVAVLREMLEDAGVTVFREQRVRVDGGVRKSKHRIRRLITGTGRVLEASVFVDASYEGDLMVSAGVSYRMPAAKSVEPPAYSFPVCLTADNSNRAPYPKPSRYDPGHYAVLLEHLSTLREKLGRPVRPADVLVMTPLPNGKTLVRTGDHLPLTHRGATVEYLEADPVTRAAIWQTQLDYTAGLFHFLATDSRVPEELRGFFSEHGPCADEFLYSHQWAHQLHIRERRLLTGDVVLTWQDADREWDGVVTTVLFRGKTLRVPPDVLAPKRSEVENLLVVMNPSAGDWVSIALRDERVTMELGAAAGQTAARAAKSGSAVQDAF